MADVGAPLRRQRTEGGRVRVEPIVRTGEIDERGDAGVEKGVELGVRLLGGGAGSAARVLAGDEPGAGDDVGVGDGGFERQMGLLSSWSVGADAA